MSEGKKMDAALQPFSNTAAVATSREKKKKKCFWSFKVLFLVNLHCFSQMGEGNKIKSELI